MSEMAYVQLSRVVRSLQRLRSGGGPKPPGQTDDLVVDDPEDESDDPQLEEAFLFLAVLACLVCCCFSTCIVRRLRRLSGYGGRYLSAELTQPLLEDEDEAMFRDGAARFDGVRGFVASHGLGPRDPLCPSP